MKKKLKTERKTLLNELRTEIEKYADTAKVQKVIRLKEKKIKKKRGTESGKWFYLFRRTLQFFPPLYFKSYCSICYIIEIILLSSKEKNLKIQRKLERINYIDRRISLFRVGTECKARIILYTNRVVEPVLYDNCRLNVSFEFRIT